MNAVLILVMLVSVVAARIAWVEFRLRRPAQRRLEAFLRERGIPFARLHASFRYAWPAYEVGFDSAQATSAFRDSPAFEEFLGEVQSLHAGLHRRGQRFNANTAVSLRPLS